MSYYFVKRTSKNNPAGYSYVGPMPLGRAEAEMAAWESCGEAVELVGATTETRAEVKRWDRLTRTADAREIVTFQGEQMTMAAYRLNYEQTA